MSEHLVVKHRPSDKSLSNSIFVLCRKPDLVVDPENVKVRESSDSTNVSDSDVPNRFSGASSGNTLFQKKCGIQAFMQRIVGGEICEIDEFPWAALLLYESSGKYKSVLIRS